MLIDGTDLILGKMGAVVAKRALEGESVTIVNCDKIVITGNKDFIIKKQQNKLKQGTHVKGPFVFRQPERFVKRSIRGMLPYKQQRGDAALQRIRCYVQIPKDVSEKPTTIKKASLASSQAPEYLTVGDVCKQLGHKQ